MISKWSKSTPLLLGLIGAVNVEAQTLEIYGEGQIEVVPDMTYVQGGVTTVGEHAEKTSVENARAVGAVFSAAEITGVDTVVSYNQAGVGPEDGRFGCVPGSHRSNYRFPGEWLDMAENIEPCVRCVTGPAGTVVIFTEALTHEALPWTGQGERRTFF